MVVPVYQMGKPRSGRILSGGVGVGEYIKKSLCPIMLTYRCHFPIRTLPEIIKIMETKTAQIITPNELLNHWQGHRALTRRVIETFPEKEMFAFSIGGMRTFAQLCHELISIGAPAMKAIVGREDTPYAEPVGLDTKAAILEQWDRDTQTIDRHFNQLGQDDFAETFNLFGQYNFTIIHNILYFIDNEIHHRGQGYVYLRAIGIEPPFFWDRP